MNNVLEVKNLTKSYGRARGIIDVNFNISKGEIFGFIGPNGAGKSTTIRCIMNQINKNAGYIYIKGETVDNCHDKLKEFVGYLPSEIHLYDDLTVKKMFEYSASFYRKDCTKKVNSLAKRLEIDVDKKIEELSLGNLKKVGIVLALMHDPELLILDEATSGLDPLMQDVFYKIILEEKQKGTTVLFSTHVLSEINKICDRVAIIKEGKIVKIENIKDAIDSKIASVTIVSKDIDKIEKTFKDEVISVENNTLKMMYKDDINKIIKELTNYSIDKLTIEDPSIEDVFMHYYE